MCECASLNVYYSLCSSGKLRHAFPTLVYQPGSSEECPFSTEKARAINCTIVLTFVCVLHIISVQI